MLKNLRLSTQINLSFLIVLLFLVAISVFAYMGLNKGYANFVEYRALARDTNLAGRIQANMLLVRLNALKYIQESSTETLASYRERLEKLKIFLTEGRKEITSPRRAELIKKSYELVNQYQSGFESVVKLIIERNDVVLNRLDPAGAAMVEAFHDIDKVARSITLSAEDYYTISTAKEALLLGRVYVNKFLVTNNVSDYEQAKVEFEEKIKTISPKINEIIAGTPIQPHYSVFESNKNTYIEALDETFSIITERNAIIDNTLNKIGPIVASNLEEVKLSVKKEQDTLGPMVQEESESSVNLIIWVSGISTVIALLMSWLIVIVIKKPIGGEPSVIAEITRSVADGDLTYRFNDETKRTGIYSSVIDMIIQLKSVIKKIIDVAEVITKSSERILAASNESSRSAIEQQEKTEQVATAMNEMSYSVQEIVKHAHDSSIASKEAIESSSKGKKTVTDGIFAIKRLAGRVETSVEVIQSLERNSESIDSVVEVIQSISEQINLLALNAAIEAARAGELGRGFAVVADEVRSLAKRTQDSTSEIQEIVTELKNGTKEVVTVMNEVQSEAQKTVDISESTGVALETIVNTITYISDMNVQVATAVEQQSVVIEEINQNISFIAVSATTAANNSSETSECSKELSDQAAELKSNMAIFKI